MGANVMQVWLRAVVIWLANAAGVEVVRSGWRQVPMSRVDFDPALAEHFKSADRAIVYALIDKWNRWNEKTGKRDHLMDGRWWSWGSHRWWVQRFAPWMSERTWGRCIGDLVGAGLLARRFVGEQPAYSTNAYSFDEARQLALFDAQFVTRGRQIAAQGGQIGDPTIGNRFKESKPHSTTRKSTTPSARARKTADAAVATFRIPAEIIGEGRDNPPEAEAREREEDGRDEAMEALRVGSRAQTSPPVAPAPSSLDRDRTAQIETVEAMPSATAIDEVTAESGDTQELMGFFTGFGAETVRDLKAKHGSDRIYAVIQAVQQEGWANNPPGAVLTRLRAGAKGGAPSFPKRDPATVDEWLRGREGQKYITGKYAEFIDH